jgi:hypothetical protein
LEASPGQIVLETLSQKNPSQKKAGGVAQGIGPEFKSQYRKKKSISIICSIQVTEFIMLIAS